LAKAEMNEKINEAKVGVISVASGSAIVLAGILVLLFAAVAALDLFWSLWFSALVVGAVTTVIGLLALGKGRSNLRIENLKPQRTLDEIRANK
jgi:xanthine/uracil permease